MWRCFWLRRLFLRRPCRGLLDSQCGRGEPKLDGRNLKVLTERLHNPKARYALHHVVLSARELARQRPPSRSLPLGRGSPIAYAAVARVLKLKATLE